jgi:predicted  nucleic acid-binding Zn-ribbon protein
MELLLSLQKLQLQAKSLSLADESEILKRREKVPVPILIHFDRLIARGKKGVAVVRSGVCSECHLRIPSGTLASLTYTAEVHKCDNCGRYLYLPMNEPLGLMDSAVPQQRGASKARKQTPADAR